LNLVRQTQCTSPLVGYAGFVTTTRTYFRSHSIAQFLAAADHILTNIGLLPEVRETKDQ
jgi:hypothetical protein